MLDSMTQCVIMNYQLTNKGDNMRMNQLMVFLSAQSTGDQGMNITKQNLLVDMLTNVGINYSTGIGNTKDWGTELAIVAYPMNSTEIEVIKQFAFKAFRQDAIVETDILGNGYLVRNNGEVSRLGKLQDASSDDKDFTQVGKYKLTFK